MPVSACQIPDSLSLSKKHYPLYRAIFAERTALQIALKFFAK
jgi:hypothetical protein